MSKTLFGLTLAGAVLFAPAAIASDQASTQSPRQQDPNEVVCKDATAETGSMLGRRKICMRRIEWQWQEQSDRDETSRAQSHSLASMPPG
jgi:hypothetical protein